MILWWFAVVIALAGHLVVAGETLADGWRERSIKAPAISLGLSLALYVALPILLVLALGESAIPVVILLFCLGLPALLRVVQSRERPLWPHLRDGLRAAFKQSRLAWIVNAALTLLLVAGVVVVVPVFEKMFKDFGGSLPGPTQALIDDSNFLRSYLFFLPLLLAIPHLLYMAWDGLVRAGARGKGAVWWFRGLTWAGLCLYAALALVAMYLPVFKLAGNIK